MKLDLKEWMAKITGQTEFKTLLWTNPNPTASFSTQTITLPDFTGYDYLEIDCDAGSAQVGYSNKYLVDRLMLGGVHWLLVPAQGATGYPSFNGQPFNYVSPTQISFKNGAYWNTTGSGQGTSFRPLRIYGIKYVGGGST